MTEIPDSLRLLYETTIENRGDRYTISIPKEVVDGSSLTTSDVYQVALLTASNEIQEGVTNSESGRQPIPDSAQQKNRGPPVEEGEVRSVTIDTLGDQGDGIAKVERGFIVIVPGTQPGDQADIEITDVKESVAFAELVTEPEVR